MRNQTKGAATAPVAGGASGAPVAAAPRHEQAAPKTVAVDRGPAPKPKLYRVMNGGTIVTASCRTVMRAGKEVSDKDYDIRMLQRQGIRLSPIEDEAEPEQAAHRPGDVVIPGTDAANSAAEEYKRMVDGEGKATPAPSPQFKS